MYLIACKYDDPGYDAKTKEDLCRYRARLQEAFLTQAKKLVCPMWVSVEYDPHWEYEPKETEFFLKILRKYGLGTDDVSIDVPISARAFTDYSCSIDMPFNNGSVQELAKSGRLSDMVLHGVPHTKGGHYWRLQDFQVNIFDRVGFSLDSTLSDSLQMQQNVEVLCQEVVACARAVLPQPIISYELVASQTPDTLGFDPQRTRRLGKSSILCVTFQPDELSELAKTISSYIEEGVHPFYMFIRVVCDFINPVTGMVESNR